MSNQVLKEIEHDLQLLSIQFDKLYAADVIVGVSKGSIQVEEKIFDLLADPVTRLDCGHYAGKTKNGLRITTVRD